MNISKEIIAAINLGNLKPLRDAVKAGSFVCDGNGESYCGGDAYCVVFHHGDNRDGVPPEKAIRQAAQIVKNAARISGKDPIEIAIILGEANKDRLVFRLSTACREHAPDNGRSVPSSCGICGKPGMLAYRDAVLFGEHLSFYLTEKGEKFFVICSACRDTSFTPSQALEAARKKWDPQRPANDPNYPDFAQMIWESVYRSAPPVEADPAPPDVDRRVPTRKKVKESDLDLSEALGMDEPDGGHSRG